MVQHNSTIFPASLSQIPKSSSKLLNHSYWCFIASFSQRWSNASLTTLVVFVIVAFWAQANLFWFFFLFLSAYLFVFVRLGTVDKYVRGSRGWGGEGGEGRRVFVGVMKYFRYILMCHEIFFKIFDGLQNIFLCSIFVISFFKLRGLEKKISKLAIKEI